MLATPVITILLVILLIFFLEAVISLLGTYRLTRRAPGIAPRDVSHLATMVRGELLDIVDALRKQGFKPVGAASIEPPFDQPQVWYYADPGGTTAAGLFVVGTTGFATLYSWLGADAACVVTTTPRGAGMIRQRDFAYRSVEAPVETALEMHRAALDEYTMRHGSPRRLDSMAEILRLDRVYNERFAARRLRPDLIRAAARALTALAIIVVLIVLQLR